MLETIQKFQILHRVQHYSEQEACPGAEGSEDRDMHLTSSGDDGILEQVRKMADIDETLSATFMRLLKALIRYSGKGSGLHFTESISLTVFVSKQVFGNLKQIEVLEVTKEGNNDDVFVEKADGSYIPLPEWVRPRMACINPKPSPKDSRCFEWAILHALHPLKNSNLKHASNVTDLRLYAGKELKLSIGTTYPIPLRDSVLRQIEELNPAFSFLIFHIGNEVDEVRPLYTSAFRFQKENHIQLGLITTGHESHFMLIKSLSALIQYSSYHKGKRFFCENCLNPSHMQEALADHERICGKNEPTNALVPKKGSKHHFIEFTQWCCLLPVPWVIYSDFEVVQSGQGVQNHTVSSFCYKIHCTYPEHKMIPSYQDKPLGEARVFCGPLALKNFYTSLFSDAAVIKQIADINFSYDQENEAEDRAAFKAATECHICGKDLRPARHFDHDHYTGKYREAAHLSCNIQYSSNKYLKIPVVFHNLRGYDGYFVVRSLLDFIDKVSKLEVIAKNLDKFTCITVNKLQFIDSLQFLNGSLDTLVKNYVEAKTGPAGELILPDLNILKVKFASVLE